MVTTADGAHLEGPANAKAPSRSPASHNPFVEISSPFKIAFLLYFLIWRILPEIAQPFYADAGSTDMEVIRSALALCAELLILWPILARSFAKIPTGWLHPLILPGLLVIATEFIKQPYLLFNPLAALGEQTLTAHEIASGSNLLSAQVTLEFWRLLSIAVTYVAFALFLPSPPGEPKSMRAPRFNRFLIVYIVLFAIAAGVIINSGGVLAHMASLAFGRFRALGGDGILIAPVTFMPMLCVFWYLCRPQAMKTPLFVGMVAVAVLLQFLILGSRSGLFAAATVFLLAWIYLHHRLPALRIGLIGLFAVMLLGVLGDIRGSGSRGDVEFEGLFNLGLEEAIERNNEQLADRQFQSGPVAVAALVPETQGYLYGETYIGGMAFFIPRAIWEEKPRGPGPTTFALLFAGLISTDGYQGKGVPIGGDAEAFFNFGYPGIVIIFALYGIALKWVTMFTLWRRTAFSAALLILVGVDFFQPSTTVLVPFLQKLVMLIVSDRFIMRHAPV